MLLLQLLLFLLLLLMQRLATLAGEKRRARKGRGSEEGSCTHPTPTQRFTGRVIRAVDVAVGVNVNVDCGVGSAAAVTAY